MNVLSLVSYRGKVSMRSGVKRAACGPCALAQAQTPLGTCPAANLLQAASLRQVWSWRGWNKD